MIWSSLPFTLQVISLPLPLSTHSLSAQTVQSDVMVRACWDFPFNRRAIWRRLWQTDGLKGKLETLSLLLFLACMAFLLGKQEEREGGGAIQSKKLPRYFFLQPWPCDCFSGGAKGRKGGLPLCQPSFCLLSRNKD